MAEENDNNEEEEENVKQEEIEAVFECELSKKWSGEVSHLGESKAEVLFHAEEEMCVDTHGLIHSSFIMAACEYAALVVINKHNIFVQRVEAEYLAPVETGTECTIKSSVKYQGDKKKIVLVQAFSHDIKVFDGTFYLLELEQHILDIKLNEEVE